MLALPIGRCLGMLWEARGRDAPSDRRYCLPLSREAKQISGQREKQKKKEGSWAVYEQRGAAKEIPRAIDD